MTDDTIQKSDAVEYVLENHWDEVRDKVLGDIREKIDHELGELQCQLIFGLSGEEFLEKYQKYSEFKEMLI